MRSLNKVLLIGNLGSDPELRRLQSGQAVTTFRLATNESWNDREGNVQQRTEWHRIVAWGKLAEICSDYMRKGRQVFVEGRLQTRQWQDQQGQARFTTEIIAQNMLMLGTRADAAVGAEAGGTAPAAAPVRAAGAPEEMPPEYAEEAGPVGGEEDSDLPF